MASHILSGLEAWDSTQTLTTGTMANRGHWNVDTTSFPGAGYYSGVTFALATSNVCSGAQVRGQAGTAACITDTTGTAAVASEVLAGKVVWDNAGAKISGTMNNRGALDASAAFPGAGYYNGTINNIPVSSGVCNGTSVFGTAGTAFCSGANQVSTALRDAGAAVISVLAGQSTSNQLEISDETGTYAGTSATPELPTTGGYNYRDVPDSSKDSDGCQGTDVKYATRPAINCGTSGTVADRIADCVAQNGASATWDGRVNGNAGQAVWKLVTRAAANKEVWQDQRTGLLWSSKATTDANWCRASGNTQSAPVTFTRAFRNLAGTAMTGNGTIGDISGGPNSLDETITITFNSATTFSVTSTSTGCNDGNGGAVTAGGLTTTAGSTVTYGRAGYCSFSITQGATNFVATDTFLITSTAAATYSCVPNENGAGGPLQPTAFISYCAEVAGASPGFAGDNWGAGTYDNAKGGMGKNAATKVMWRLPTMYDFMQAEIDGFMFVLPDAGAPGIFRTPPDASAGSSQFEWTSTVGAGERFKSYYHYPRTNTAFIRYGRNNNVAVRCVGR